VLLALFTIICAAGVAWANGANDVSKGVATLVGSRLATYRQGLSWGTGWTVVGAVAALVFTTALLRTFSTGLVSGEFADSPLFPLSVATGAFTWVLFASRTGLPVSTTHALAGAIVGTAVAAAGLSGVRWGLVLNAVALPLALSPLFAAGLTYLAHGAARRHLSAAAQYCVCVVQPPMAGLAGGPLPDSEGGSATTSWATSLPIVVVDQERACAQEQEVSGVRVTDAAHWMTSAALSFARGLNDTPKIVALAMVAATGAGFAAAPLYVACAVAMGAGSLIAGRRVTRTLAERVTEVEPLEGLAASGVAAALVLAASFVALPVSTTHVATGAIVGAGLGSGGHGVRWNTVSGVVAAWVITLPASAAVSAATWWLGTQL
jgi:PiT family inorganic phosphate transporter